jgi:hypothetical protein
MERNSYAPPEAPIADSEPLVGDAGHVRELSRPRAVIIAGCLIVLSVAIAGIDAATDTNSTSSFGSIVTIVWFVVLVFLVAGFVYKLFQGRNWARVTYVVILVVGIPSVITTIRDVMIAPSAFGVEFLLQSIIQFSALGLLFSPSARAWFRKR